MSSDNTAAWQRIYFTADADGSLPCGRFKVCTTCEADLPLWSEETVDPEYLLYHGYCSKDCASEGFYANYQW